VTVLSRLSGKRTNWLMKTSFLLAIFVATTFSCGTAFAQSNDMAITVNKPAGINPPNSISILSVTINNLGPDPSRGTFLVSDVVPTFPVSLFQPVTYTFISGPCDKNPADVLPWDTFGVWTTPTLDAGESITCNWQFEVEAEPSFDPVLVTWRVLVSNSDPDPSNNNHSLIFAFSGTVDVPTLMTPASSFLLLVMLLMGFRQIVGRD